MNMVRRLFTASLLIGAAVVVVQSLPDLARYMRIRNM